VSRVHLNEHSHCLRTTNPQQHDDDGRVIGRSRAPASQSQQLSARDAHLRHDENVRENDDGVQGWEAAQRLQRHLLLRRRPHESARGAHAHTAHAHTHTWAPTRTSAATSGVSHIAKKSCFLRTSRNSGR
jgi:hypothetical protein